MQFKAGDRVKIKRGINTNEWHPSFVKYYLDQGHLIVSDQVPMVYGNMEMFIVNGWGAIPCEYFELVKQRKHRIKLP